LKLVAGGGSFCPMTTPTYSRAFLQEVPKSDLHLHLDGSLRLSTLIELAKSRNVALPSCTAEGLLELVFKDRYANLGEYLRGFAYTCAVMRDRESIARIAAELVEDNLAEGVRYIEVRFAPQLHVHDDLDMKDVLVAVAEGLAAGAKSHNASEAVRSGEDIPFESGIIACALRSIKPGMGPYYKKLVSAFCRSAGKRIMQPGIDGDGPAGHSTAGYLRNPGCWL
jgi:adenosine deaminase